MTHRLKIAAITPLARNVFQYDLEKPEGLVFEPGQAVDVSIGKEGWEDEKRPFTFTSLPCDDRLQFMIKSYPDHGGVTEQLARLIVGDMLIIDEPFGTIAHRGEGTFIAGGAGVTPFIAILRDLERQGRLAGHRLLLANRTERDIFPQAELDAMAGLDVTHILSEEQGTQHETGRIDRAFLERSIDDLSQKFYVCGPPQMVEDVNDALKQLGAEPDGLVFEE